jgi:hypothetical protein
MTETANDGPSNGPLATGAAARHDMVTDWENGGRNGPPPTVREERLVVKPSDAIRHGPTRLPPDVATF